jgi:hypothetical protein
MAKDKQPQRPKVDPLAAEIDALLKKLPHADPGLKGEGAPRPGNVPSAAPQSGAPPTRTRDRPPPSSRKGILALWGVVLLGVVFGVALTQWPYRSDCGWPLYGYSAVVALLLIVGAWGGLASWRQRIGAAHLVSTLVVFWGLVLAADVILPRIGYAVDAATWRCQPPTPVTPGPPVVVPPPATVEPGVVGPQTESPLPGATIPAPDSAQLTPDTVMGTDSQPAPDSIPG